MRRRPLSREDREAWDRIRATARPLRPGRPADGAPGPPAAPVPSAPPPSDAPARSAPPADPPAPSPRPFRIGEAVDHRRSDGLLPGLVEGQGRAPLRMDAGTFGRMARGKVRPEARLDLHGMFADEAHAALTDFVLGARAKGRRLVLVITGKGRPADDAAPMPAWGERRGGRLRHDVPRWLALPPLAGVVLQVAPAHRRHGGAGALYVYLRGR